MIEYRHQKVGNLSQIIQTVGEESQNGNEVSKHTMS